MKRLPVTDYEGLYEVSESGVIYSLDRVILGRDDVEYPRKGIQLSQTIHRDTGYLMVSLWKNNKWVNHYVHRVVAQAFIPNLHNKPEVNHKDSNRLNPKASNLEWVTRAENALHGYREGLNWQPKKLSETQISEALTQFLCGTAMTHLAEYFGVGLSRLTINLRQLAKKTSIEGAFDEELVYQRTLRNRQANENKRQKVSCYNPDGSLHGTYPSLTAATKALGKKSSGTISNALNPDKKQEIAYGYTWRYSN